MRAPDWLTARPVAHRGLHDRARGIIENAHAAFEAAINAGYAIECDVQLSSDGVPFIFHDDDFDRLTSAKGPSDALPIAEVKKLAGHPPVLCLYGSQEKDSLCPGITPALGKAQVLPGAHHFGGD